jgi:hypothetical protein
MLAVTAAAAAAQSTCIIHSEVLNAVALYSEHVQLAGALLAVNAA